MTKTVEVEQELENLISEEITDPNQTRRKDNQQFVFTEKPNINSKYPYILISLQDPQKQNLSIGKTNQFHRHRIQVAVRVNKKNEFNINDGTNNVRGAGYTRNWLAERIDEVIQNNQSRFRNLGDDIYSILPDSGNPQTSGNTNGTVNDYILRRTRS